MALTTFPIETTDPRIEVTLPVGRHVLELVVEDSAGLRSAPDQVIIEVRQEAALATITGINPVSGSPGSNLEAVISGTMLNNATAVTFDGSGVKASIGVGGTSTTLPIVVSIAAGTPAGSRSFTVSTPAGSAASPAGVTFSVVLEPQIRPIAPSPRVVLPEPRVSAPELITAEPRAIIVEPAAITPAVTPVAPEVRVIAPEIRAVVPDVRSAVGKAGRQAASGARTPAGKGKK